MGVIASSPFTDNADGSREFDCSGCGMHVIQAMPDFDFPVCVTCRWFDERPQIPSDVKNRFLGCADVVVNNEAHIIIGLGKM